MEAPLRGGAPGPFNKRVMLSHCSGGVGVLVEIADQPGSEKRIVAKTKSQEGRPCVTICSGKKSGERQSLPLLNVAGGDKEVAGKVRNNLRRCRRTRANDRRHRHPCGGGRARLDKGTKENNEAERTRESMWFVQSSLCSLEEQSRCRRGHSSHPLACSALAMWVCWAPHVSSDLLVNIQIPPQGREWSNPC